ncbi:MAG: hypothetical protein J6B22_01360 [Clostridia bacterium]|nr:hypothetical protein [Clostridia bacterium]
MLTKVLMQGVEQSPTPKEGDLYKEVTIFGKTFRLLYGYYESFERESPFNDPIPIYPDFIKEPHYTAEGIPIATEMQNVCEFYNGKNDEDSSCSDCSFFQKYEELFGLCNCPQNKRCCKERADVKNE